MHETMISVDALRAGPAGAWPQAYEAPVAAAVAGGICRVVVWGTGQGARDFVAHLRPGVELVAFVDNNSARWGEFLDGTPVIAPATLGSLAFDRLTIASVYAAEIVAQLETLDLFNPDTTVACTARRDWWQCEDLLVKGPWFDKLQIGLTSRCNLVCQHCPRESDSSVYHDLGFDKFRTFLKGFNPSQFTDLLVSDFGENTLLKDYLAYLRTAKEMGWQQIEFVTNATNGKRDLWDAIFGEDLARRVIVSIESADPAGFESVRGFPWERFSRNVATIADCIEQHGRRAELVFNAVCMKSNLHTLPGIVDFAAAHRAKLYMVHLNPSNMFNNPLGRPENHLETVPRDEVLTVFREVKRRAAAFRVPLWLPEPFPELEVEAKVPETSPTLASLQARNEELLCMQPLRWVEVGDNGNVYPCCQMAKRFPVGNLNTQTFDEIWKGPAYRRLLDGLKPEGTPLNVCRQCNMYRGKNF